MRSLSTAEEERIEAPSVTPLIVCVRINDRFEIIFFLIFCSGGFEAQELTAKQMPGDDATSKLRHHLLVAYAYVTECGNERYMLAVYKINKYYTVRYDSV